MDRAKGPRTSRKNPTRSVASSSVALTSSFRRRTVIVARRAARRLRTQWTSPQGAQIQRLPETSMIARRGARQAALPTADGDEPVEAHRDASGDQGLEE